MALLRSTFRCLVLGPLGLLAGCTALLDTDASQCETNDDCTAKGAAFAGLVCNADKVCAEPPCTNQRLCTTVSRQEGFCVQSKCQPLFTEECTTLLPPRPLIDRDVVLGGFMASLRGGDASYGEPQLDGAAVALRQIESSGGLRAVPGAVANDRTLAMLVCDQGNWAEAKRHLVEDLRVPVIVGASYSSVTKDMADQIKAKSEDVLLFSQAATAPDLNEFGVKGLLWRTAPSDIYQTEALKRLYDRVAAALKAQGVARPTLAMTIKSDKAGSGLYTAATSVLSDPNVKNPAPALQVDLPLRLPTGPMSEGWAGAIQEVLDLKPDIIMHLGTAEFVQLMMEPIEERWVGTRKPWYLLPEGSRVNEVLALAAKHPEWKLHERVIGTAPGARRDTFWNEFVSAYRSFPTASRGLNNQQPLNLAEYAYDAVYLLAYATARSRLAVPTGNALAVALREMSCKGPGRQEIVPNASGVIYGMSYAAASTQGSCVDYKGPSGELDFNPDKGEAASDYSVWCLRRSRSGYGFEPALDPYYSYVMGTLPTEGLDFTKVDWCAANL